jgi:hypothetical protein
MQLVLDQLQILVMVSQVATNTFNLKLRVLDRHPIAAMAFQTAAGFK